MLTALHKFRLYIVYLHMELYKRGGSGVWLDLLGIVMAGVRFKKGVGTNGGRCVKAEAGGNALRPTLK